MPEEKRGPATVRVPRRRNLTRRPGTDMDGQLAWSCWRCRRLFSEEEAGHVFTYEGNVLCPGNCGGLIEVRNV